MNITYRGKSGNPPRVLKYRASVKWAAIFSQYYSFVLFLIFLNRVTLFIYSLYSTGEIVFLDEAAIAGFVWMGFYFIHFFILKQDYTSEIQVFEDSLFIKRSQKEIEIKYDDIREIKFYVHKSTGGWFTLYLNDKTHYRFAITVERVDYIIDSIYKYRPELIGNEKFFNIRKHFILFDHGLGRLKELFKTRNLTFILGSTVSLMFVFGVIFGIKQSSQYELYFLTRYMIRTLIIMLLGVGVVGIIFGVVLLPIFNNLTDADTLKRLANDPFDKRRDMQLETTYYRPGFIIYILLLILVLAGIFFKDINMLDIKKISLADNFLKLDSSNFVVFDTRFNCVTCSFPLKHRDVVVVKDYGLVRVIGLPGERIFVNQKDQQGRFVVAKESTELAPKQLGILVQNGDVLTSIESKLVVGKVLR